jgi:hypothetical protein
VLILGAPAAIFVFKARCWAACTCNIWARVALAAGARCCEMLTCERICATATG